MAKIHTLSPMLANQIAAGEVIDRPASVVKELIENSLDAHATHIQIELLQGGAARITLLDNGEGIDKEDLPLALKRHATSKVSNLEDLHNIQSLGFRGEALASVASVAKCVLTSKPKHQEGAWSCSVKGHDQKPYVFPASLVEGTQLCIQDLFYNVPARRKFLKSAKTEFNHTEWVVKKAALSHPHVTFSLKHNEKLCLEYKATRELARRIEQVCGKKFIQNAYEIRAEHAQFIFHGWLGNESVFRKHADCQFFFINHRPVRDKILQHAIKNAFYQMGFNLEQNFPSYVLFLQCPPSEVDVNVHPTKHEVRFNDPSWVHDFIQKCLMQTLQASPEEKETPRKPQEPKRSEALSFLKPYVPMQQDTFPAVSLELDVNKSKPAGTASFLWKHFFLDFQDCLRVLNLKAQRQALWIKLLKEAEGHPWPSRVCLFPSGLSHLPPQIQALESYGLLFRKNLSGVWQITATPAFLDPQQVEALKDCLMSAKPQFSMQEIQEFFKSLPWQIFANHSFFRERFQAWDNHFKGFQILDASDFEGLLEQELA